MALSSGRHLAFPFRIGSDGRTAAPASDAEHVRDELLQLLLTARANGCSCPTSAAACAGWSSSRRPTCCAASSRRASRRRCRDGSAIA